MKTCKFSKPCICRICEGCEETYCDRCDGDPFLYCSEFAQADGSKEANQLLQLIDRILRGDEKVETAFFGGGDGRS